MLRDFFRRVAFLATLLAAPPSPDFDYDSDSDSNVQWLTNVVVDDLVLWQRTAQEIRGIPVRRQQLNWHVITLLALLSVGGLPFYHRVVWTKCGNRKSVAPD